MSETQTTGRMPGTPPTAEEESRVRSTAHGAAEQASALASTGRDEVARVAQDVRAQSTRLVGDARSSARDRADAQFGQLATRLQDLSGELDEMSRNARPHGPLAAVAHDGATAMRQMSRHIEEDGLDATLRDVRRFARQRPFLFLGGALAVGLVAGRVMRNADLATIGNEAREPATAATGDAGPMPRAAGTPS